MANNYRQLKTTVAQTAANAAVQALEARVAEGGVSTIEAFNELFDAIFAKLSPVVDEDNNLLAAQEATTAKAASSKDPGETVFTGGKFKGLTIREVFEMDETKAKEDYGHQFGDGASYITNYVATTKNSNETTRTAATSFLALVKG